MKSNTRSVYIDAAVTLARHICCNAIWSEDACNWIGSTNEDLYGAPRLYTKSLPTAFYDGTAGVAFFLCQALKLEEDEIVRQTAEGALNQVIRYAIESPPATGSGKIGFYTGYPGLAFVLYKAGEILKRPDYTRAAAQLIKMTINLPKEDWGLDMIDGAAGAIPVLMQINSAYPDKSLQAFILRLGEFLIEKAVETDGGRAWYTIQPDGRPLTGFGHGASGISTALLELFNLTKQNKWLEFAKSGFAYENKHFVKSQQNWPDFRSEDRSRAYSPATNSAEPSCGMAWCHGAPGIALSRLRAYEITGEPGFREDAETAIATTEKQYSLDYLGNFSLCHGLLGNGESLLYAADILKRPALREKVENVAVRCYNDYIAKTLPLPNGLHGMHETPDFMLGTSGMGYFFLRLYDERRFPPTLLFRP